MGYLIVDCRAGVFALADTLVCFIRPYMAILSIENIFFDRTIYGSLFAASEKKPWIVKLYRPKFVLDGMRHLFHHVVLKSIFMFKSNSFCQSEKLIVFFRYIDRARRGLVDLKYSYFWQFDKIRVRRCTWRGVFLMCGIGSGYWFLLDSADVLYFYGCFMVTK